MKKQLLWVMLFITSMAFSQTNLPNDAIVKYTFNNRSSQADNTGTGGGRYTLTRVHGALPPGPDLGPKGGRDYAISLNNNGFSAPSLDNNPQAYTLSLWFKGKYEGVNQYLLYDMKNSANTTGTGFEVYLNNNNKPVFVTNASKLGIEQSTQVVKTGSKVVGDETWHHMAVTVKKKTFTSYSRHIGTGIIQTIYIDGVKDFEKSSSSSSRLLTNSPNESIGLIDKNQSFYLSRFKRVRGSLDNVHIYDRALTDAEITAIYDDERLVIPVNSVTINSTTSVVLGQTLNMTANVSPSTATNKNINWSIVQGGTGTATITSAGVLTPSSVGTVTVKATSVSDTTKSATIQVTIINQIARLYVNQNAQAGGNGHSWTTAYTSLQDALDNVGNSADKEIWIAKGTYKDTRTSTLDILTLTEDGVKIYGGFAGTENSLGDRRDIHTTNRTILSGDDSKVSVLKIDGDNTILDGLTFSGGKAQGVNESNGSGIRVRDEITALTINNCIIERNFSAGVAVLIKKSNVNFELNVTNSIIRHNKTGAGTLYVFTTDNNVEITINLINNLFVKNVTDQFAGSAGWFRAMTKGSKVNVNIVNNTIVDNADKASVWGRSTDNTPIAVGKEKSNTTAIVKCFNSIFWNNRTNGSSSAQGIGRGLAYFPYPTVTISNSIGYFHYGYSMSNTVMNRNPYLTSEYKLSSSSSAIDGGDNSKIPVAFTTDLLGNARIHNGKIDLGVYEYGSAPLSTTNIVTNEASTKVYPNPVKDMLTIHTSSVVTKVEIYTILGAKVYSTTNTTFNIEHLLKGVYIVKVEDELGNVITKKIIKQ